MRANKKTRSPRVQRRTCAVRYKMKQADNRQYMPLSDTSIEIRCDMYFKRNSFAIVSLQHPTVCGQVPVVPF